ncbi:MAG: FHA domain-containing protein [Kiritimatiellaeota bacterium]|nr:FHA domain-containing protein [Kiritimatiellota bacterium]
MKKSKVSSNGPEYSLRVHGPGGEAGYPLDRFPCCVGRNPDCDVVIADPSVSGRHATFERDADGNLVLVDNRSTNGTYVDGSPISRLKLRPPVRIIMGKVSLEVLEKGGKPLASHSPRPGPLPLPPGVGAGPGLPATRSDGDSGAAPGGGECFYRRAGKEHGPFTRAQLREMAAKGLLRRTDLVWVDGADAWLRADLVEGVFSGVPAGESPAPVVEQPDNPAAQTSGYFEDLLEFPVRKARGEITCPHCWHTFDVEEFLFIARHQALVGDPVLGPDAQQRFLPSKFTPEGNAVDSMGMSCPDMACPRCHLRIPKSASEMPPLFLSIVGAPASGKSYFLTGMIWRLRNELAQNFAIAFTDTDAINNQILNDFEETLFLNSDQDQLVTLRKTELQGELYNQVLLDGMIINLPRPFMFSITPAEHHPQYEQVKDKMSRTLVLYDNAGEHFEPGMDSVDNPTTRHLLHSDIIFFLFDPTKDVRFRQLCHATDPQLEKGARVQRQEILLTEMINRIKKYSGMKADAKTAKTLIIVVPKYDVWADLLDYPTSPQPWKWEARYRTCALDVEEIKNVSFAVRGLLERVCPEVVATAESFAGDVLYLPNSALGRSPEIQPDSGLLAIRPRDIRPFWISMPMLYFFHERGFIPSLPRRSLPDREVVPVEYKVSGDVVFVFFPDREKPLQIPVCYMGCRLRDPQSGKWFELPARRRRRKGTYRRGSSGG